jgi:predicted transcriptional regulator
MKPRSIHAIMAGILHVCEQRTKRTHIIYKANLSHSMLLEYVQLALRNGLLQEMPDRTLLIAEKGREYLAHFTIVERMLQDSVHSNNNNESDRKNNDSHYQDHKMFQPLTIS